MSRFVLRQSGITALSKEKEFVEATSGLPTRQIVWTVAEVAPKVSGGYVRKLRVTQERDRRTRPFGRVHNDDIAAHIIEWGGNYTPAYAPIRRGTERLGFTIREDYGEEGDSGAA